MARKADRLALITDSRLSDTARVLGLYIEALGDDWREIAADQLASIAYGTPKLAEVAKHLRQLAIFGYIARRPGGRGHSDRFRWAFSPPPGPGANSRIDPPVDGGLNAPIGPIDPLLDGCLSDRHPSGGGSKPPRTREARVLAVSSLGDDEEKPPIVPLSSRVEAALRQHSALLPGCRDSLRDYLRQRVPEEQHYGYVQTLAGWLNDLEDVWRLPDGSRCRPERRAKKLAAALNKLAASDERKMSRPVGDPDNLRVKLSFVLKREIDDERVIGHEPGHHRGEEPGQKSGGAAGEYEHLR